MKINSLRLRFALWVSAFLLGSLLVFGIYVYVSMSRNLRVATDDALRLSATQAAGTLNVDNGHIILADNLPENNSDMEALRARGFTVRFLDVKRNLLGGFGANWNVPLSTTATVQRASFLTTTSDQGKLDSRVYTLPVMDGDQIVGYVQTSQSLELVQQTLGRLLLSLLVGIPLLTLIAALGGYFLAGRALAPVDSITLIARRISAEDLSARLNLPDHSDELGRLASTFDGMLARLEESFRRERQFTSDASHELRTPLAAMQTIIGVTRSRTRTTREYEEALDDLGEETERLRSLGDSLLALARGEKPAKLQKDRLDLSSIVVDVAQSLAPLAEAKGLALELCVQPDLAVNGDRDGLIRLFVNLLDNAIKFTDSGTVTISGERDGKEIRFAIKDTGTGIAEKHWAHIFDRFYRADAARTQAGSGLGLTIALQIVQTHSGSIRVDSEPGAGTTFFVALPAA